MHILPEDRNYLLSLAREAIAAVLNGKGLDEVRVDEEGLRETLREKRGVFVTLTRNNELRGCIGYIFALLPLWQAVIENARNAAFRDPRFAPLMPGELDDIAIEISVLTPPEAIADINGFEVGRHGIILKKGVHQAVFLPQVAPEQGWDAETTLMHLSLKAGLAPDGWKKGAQFEVFEAEVFGEE